MRILFTILLVVIGFVVNGQLPANTFPTQNSTGLFIHGWDKHDSGNISAVRDTFYARYIGTRILRISGGDTSEWFYAGNRRWFKALKQGDILTGTFFQQGGNSFGDTAVLGTHDNFPLVLRINDVNKGIITSSRVGFGTLNPSSNLEVRDSTGNVIITASAPNGSSILNVVGGVQANLVLNGVSANINTSIINTRIQQPSTMGVVGSYDWVTFLNGNQNQTTGNGVGIYSNQTFAPTSGTATHTSLRIGGFVNQTGGANGSTWGLRVNPTIQSAANFISIQSDTGNVVFKGGNVGINTETPSSRLHVAGTGTFLDTLTATTMGNSDSSDRAATTAWVKRHVGSGNFFQQEGNSFGDTAILGTNDNFPLGFKVNGNRRVLIPANGRINFNTQTQSTRAQYYFKGVSGGSSPSVSDGTEILNNTLIGSFINGLLFTSDSAIGCCTAENTILTAQTEFAVFKGIRTNGSFANPVSVTNNDILVRLQSNGFDGTSSISRGAIQFFVDGTPSTNNVPTAIQFFAGSTTFTERARITSAGLFGVNTTTPTTQLHVVGTGLFTDTLTATTMGNPDSSNRVASTAWVKRQGYGSGGGGISGSLTAGRVTLSTGTNSVGDDAGFTYDGTTLGQLSSGATHKVINNATLSATSGGTTALYTYNTPTASTDQTGIINFGSAGAGSNNYIGASIAAFANGSWTGGSSHFARLVFSTTNSGSATPSEVMRISNNRVSIGTGSTGTSYLTLRAGSAGVNGAPLGFTISGAALLTTPEAAKVEVDANGRLFWSPAAGAGNREQVLYADSVGAIPNGMIFQGNSTHLTGLALGTANQMLRVNAGATALEYFTPPQTASGTYTPTITTGTNVTGTPTAHGFKYMVIGNEVHISGRIKATTTTSGITSTLEITLPPGFTSDIQDVDEVSGTVDVGNAIANPDPTYGGYATGNTSTNRIVIYFKSASAAEDNSIWIEATYTISVL